MAVHFFSVIIPVYNVKAYLKQCVDSILVQDFIDYELILVDDGSTDDSGEICDEYKKNDSRIMVIHKKNGGLSEARNVGLDIASGNYVWFVDSDDYLLEKTAFGTVADIIKKKNADVVFFSYKKFYENSGKYSKSIYADILENTDIRECIRLNAYKALAWNKVTRLSQINKYNMRFPVGCTGEDLAWCADLLAYADKIVLCKNDLMAYRQRPESITGNKNKQFRIRHIENVIFLMNEVINKYRIGKSNCNENELIGHYLGYEFSWLLGTVYPFWDRYSVEIKKLMFLLDYALCEKVKRVSKMRQLFGIRVSSFFLWEFIKNMRK